MPLIQIKASGNSMAPFLLPGDIVSIKKTALKSLEVDDIASFLDRGKLITHRVVFIDKKSGNPFFIPKGDFNQKSDNKVFEKQLIGKVVKVKRKDVTFAINDLYKFNSHHYLQEINKLIHLFEKNKIHYLILKGLPLYLLLNNKFPNRIFADCDILIRKKDFAKSHKLLVKLGYSNLSPLERAVDPEVTYNKIINHFKVTFDIHTELCFMKIQKSSLDMLYPHNLLVKFNKQFRSNKQTQVTSGIEYNFPNWDYLFVYLALHLYRHNFRGYNRYQIIKDLLSTQSVNLNNVHNIITEFKLSQFILPGLKLFYKNYHHPQVLKLITSLKTKTPISSFYFQKKLSEINIFEDQWPANVGLERFLNLLFLSPAPFYFKIKILFYLPVWRAVLRVVKKRVIFYQRLIFFRLKNQGFFGNPLKPQP